MQIEVNGAATECFENTTLARLIKELGYADQRIAVEHNGQIVPRDRFEQTPIAPGDTLEIVHAIGGGQAVAEADSLTIAGRRFESRLLVGTGKYADLDQAEAASRSIVVARGTSFTKHSSTNARSASGTM